MSSSAPGQSTIRHSQRGVESTDAIFERVAESDDENDLVAKNSQEDILDTDPLGDLSSNGLTKPYFSP